jgi:hypothetical protein
LTFISFISSSSISDSGRVMEAVNGREERHFGILGCLGAESYGEVVLMAEGNSGIGDIKYGAKDVDDEH